MWRKLLGGLTALLVPLAAAAYLVLAPSEAVRPPPPGVAEPMLVQI
jgi:hypothetical protein